MLRAKGTELYSNTDSPAFRALRPRRSATSSGQGCSVCVCLFKCFHYDRQPFLLSMPAAMHLTVLLCLFAVLLRTDSTPTSSATQPGTKSTTNDPSQQDTSGKMASSSPPSTLPPTTSGSEATHTSLPIETLVTNQMTTPIPITNQTTTQIPGTNQTTTQIPGTNQTTTWIPGTNQTTTQIPGTNQTTTQIPGTNQTTTQIPGTNQTTTQIPGTNQTTTQIPGTNQTTTWIPGTNQAASNGSTILPTPGSANTTANTPVYTTSPALSPEKGPDLASNPGLVAIICIFCIVLVLVLVLAAMKCTSPRRNNFERLEDVPMGKVTEGSPFAHYSK